jgi:hypothetical protein
MDRIQVRPQYPLNDFCREFGIGRTRAYQEIAAGRLKSFKIGKLTFVTGEAALAWRSLYYADQQAA